MSTPPALGRYQKELKTFEDKYYKLKAEQEKIDKKTRMAETRAANEERRRVEALEREYRDTYNALTLQILQTNLRRATPIGSSCFVVVPFEEIIISWCFLGGGGVGLSYAEWPHALCAAAQNPGRAGSLPSFLSALSTLPCFSRANHSVPWRAHFLTIASAMPSPP